MIITVGFEYFKQAAFGAESGLTRTVYYFHYINEGLYDLYFMNNDGVMWHTKVYEGNVPEVELKKLISQGVPLANQLA